MSYCVPECAGITRWKRISTMIPEGVPCLLEHMWLLSSSLVVLWTVFLETTIVSITIFLYSNLVFPCKQFLLMEYLLVLRKYCRTHCNFCHEHKKNISLVTALCYAYVLLGSTTSANARIMENLERRQAAFWLKSEKHPDHSYSAVHWHHTLLHINIIGHLLEVCFVLQFAWNSINIYGVWSNVKIHWWYERTHHLDKLNVR